MNTKKLAELISRKLEKDAVQSRAGDYSTNKVFIGKQNVPKSLIEKTGK